MNKTRKVPWEVALYSLLRAFAVSSAVGLSAGAANSADMIDPVMPPSNTVNWTGLHLGAGVGYGGATQTGSLELYNEGPGGLLQLGPIDLYSIGTSIALGADGGIATIEGGYDFEIGNNIVLGIAGDYTWSSISSQLSVFGDVCYENYLSNPSQPNDDCSLGVTSDTPDITYTLKSGNNWSVIGRAGYLVDPVTLVYGLYGYTNTDMDADITLHSIPTGSIQFAAYDYDRDGWTWGGGVEAMIGRDISAKLEYRNTSWSESQNISFGGPAGIRFTDEASIQTIRGVLSWRPGAGGGTVADSASASGTAVASGSQWTGFHVGAGGGYGIARQTGTLELYDNDLGGLIQVGPIDLQSIGTSIELGGDGGLGTVEAGYDVELPNNIVIGIAGDYTWSGMDAQMSLFGGLCYEFPITGTNDADDDCSLNRVSETADLTYTLTTGDSWSIIGRAGYLVSPKTLFYGLAGYTSTAMEADLTLDAAIVGGSQTLVSYEYDRDGWTFGAGMETIFAQNLSLKFEYRNVSWTESRDIPFTDTAGIRFEDDAMVQSARAVVSWRM
jgi:outer membrane immunogenic protein